jgi:excisionase family DNA binding protein
MKGGDMTGQTWRTRRLLRPEEAADALAVSRSKVYELMRSGRLGAIKIDGSRRVPVEAVDDFIERAKEEVA